MDTRLLGTVVALATVALAAAPPATADAAETASALSLNRPNRRPHHSSRWFSTTATTHPVSVKPSRRTFHRSTRSWESAHASS
jgi:hypothetical protein